MHVALHVLQHLTALHTHTYKSGCRKAVQLNPKLRCHICQYQLHGYSHCVSLPESSMMFEALSNRLQPRQARSVYKAGVQSADLLDFQVLIPSGVQPSTVPQRFAR